MHTRRLVLDREALVLRNQSMAEAFHQLPIKHYIRRYLLRIVARLPVTNQRSDSERILLIRPDHLGDMLLTTPAIEALRRAKPDAEIHALVGPWSAQILSNYPQVDRVLTLPFPGFSRSPKESIRFPYQLALRSARHLRLIGYDSAIIFRPDHWWGAMLAFLAGIPHRIGYDLPDVKQFLTQSFTHEKQHVVQQNLKLVSHWTRDIDLHDINFNFAVNEADTAFIDGYLAEWNITPEQNILCIHPGSGTWVKRWKADRWAIIADTLSDQLDCIVIFTGGDHEMSLVDEITAQMSTPYCIMVGDTQVNQLAALYQRSKIVLGPDSGPLHLAVAVHTPTVTLFGPADPVEFGPWGSSERHKVLHSDIACQPCRVLDWGGDNPDYHPCMRDISVGRVLDSARRATNPG